MILTRSYDELPQSIADRLKLANVFFSANYERYINALGQKIIYLNNESLIIPVVIYEKIGIKYGMYASEYFELEKNILIEEKQKFLDEVQNVLKKQEKLAWVGTTAAALFDIYPINSMRIPFGSHIIDLNNSVEELWKNVHSKHRNSIRRAEKSEIEVKLGGKELLKDYLYLDEETWKRSEKKSYGEKFFVKMLDALQENIMIVVAYKDNQPQAGACYFLNNQMCYYMYGVSADRPEPGAANYLHWEVIKFLKEQSVGKYSFVGCRINEDQESKYHGIQRFKERFGGELNQGYMFKSVLNKRKYTMFRTLYKLKNHHELTDPVDEEIVKWKELNK